MTHISLCTNATRITAPARLLMCDTERGERNKPRSPLIHPVLCILMCKSCLWSTQQRFVLQVCKGLSQITWWGAELLKTWCTSTYRAMTSQLTNQTPVLKHGWREEWKRARWRGFSVIMHWFQMDSSCHLLICTFICSLAARICSMPSSQSSALITLYEVLTHFFTC